MAASQPKRFDENFELAEPARSEDPGASATAGTKAAVIPIEAAETERALELSTSGRSRHWVPKTFAVFSFDSIVMAAVIALLPIGALYLARSNKSLPRALEKTSAKTRIPVPARTASGPSVHDKTAALLQPSVVGKPDRTRVLSDVRYTSDSVSAVVLVDLDQAAQFEVHRISSPDRIYLDLQNTKLAAALVGKEIQTQDRFLRALRVGEHERQTTRITLATAQTCTYSVTRAPNSSQLRIELRQAKTQARENKPGTVAKK